MCNEVLIAVTMLFTSINCKCSELCKVCFRLQFQLNFQASQPTQLQPTSDASFATAVAAGKIYFGQPSIVIRLRDPMFESWCYRFSVRSLGCVVYSCDVCSVSLWEL